MALKEVCIAARTSASGNTLEGDIIVIREPLGYVGKKEQNNFIWLYVDEADLPDPSNLRGGDDQVVQTKHRFNIPLAGIPGLNLTRARDAADRYQPFMTITRSDGTIIEPQTISAAFVEKL